MTTIFQDLCALPLEPGHGVPLGFSYLPDPHGIDQEDAFDVLAENGRRLITEYVRPWRFAVEVITVGAESLLGTFVLGTGRLAVLGWEDVTPHTEGLHWKRGGEPASRPIAGELTFRLQNYGMEYSPWQSPFYAPGTMVRVVVSDGTEVIGQFCGQTVIWNESCAGLRAYEWVDVTVWENMFLLSEVNDHGLAGVIGGGDTLTQRVDRLMTQADWQFDVMILSTSAATYQATNFSQDVLSELYKTVDSIDAVVYSAKDGALTIRDRATGSGVHLVLEHDDQNPDSVLTANDDGRILSSVDLARVGGTVVHYDNPGMAARYQRRSTKRTDMITVAEAGDADLARVADGMLARARQTYRPVHFSIESGQGDNQAAMIIDNEITDRITLDHDVITFTDYAICAVEHDVTVAGGGVPYWRCTISLDIEADSAWEVV
jgi:hypothetical protein